MTPYPGLPGCDAVRLARDVLDPVLQPLGLQPAQGGDQELASLTWCGNADSGLAVGSSLWACGEYLCYDVVLGRDYRDPSVLECHTDGTWAVARRPWPESVDELDRLLRELACRLPRIVAEDLERAEADAHLDHRDLSDC